MGELFDFRENTYFTAGTVGEPGNRTFYLQLGDLTCQLSVKLEKQQVAALSNFLKNILNDLPEPQITQQIIPPTIFQPPQSTSWVAGEISVGIERDEQTVIVKIEEAKPFAEELLGQEEDPNNARIIISTQQAQHLIQVSDSLMKKGRPPCKLCGKSQTAFTHICPRLN